jgi:hypothetical protein
MDARLPMIPTMVETSRSSGRRHRIAWRIIVGVLATVGAILFAALIYRFPWVPTAGMWFVVVLLFLGVPFGLWVGSQCSAEESWWQVVRGVMPRAVGKYWDETDERRAKS